MVNIQEVVWTYSNPMINECLFQMLTNVLLSQTHVMLMLTVLILMGVMSAHVMLDTLEMGFHVQVWLYEIQILKMGIGLLNRHIQTLGAVSHIQQQCYLMLTSQA